MKKKAPQKDQPKFVFSDMRQVAELVAEALINYHPKNLSPTPPKAKVTRHNRSVT